MNIKDLIKNNTVTFSHIRKGEAFYNISFEDETFQFPVPISDMGDATFNAKDKAILFMRYIRKAIADELLLEVK